MQLHKQYIKVWDLFIRLFHWILLFTFGFAYWTSQSGMQELHAVLGYVLLSILLVRVIWGLIGSTHARFSSFVRHPVVVVRYLRSIVAGAPAHYVGHNPAGGAMVLALLLILLLIAVTGFVELAVIEFDGPLALVFPPVSDQWAYSWSTLHQYAVNIIWVLVALHLLGVVLACIQHRENLVWSMVTGRKFLVVSEINSNNSRETEFNSSSLTYSNEARENQPC